jgi:hypothetical protein
VVRVVTVVEVIIGSTRFENFHLHFVHVIVFEAQLEQLEGFNEQRTQGIVFRLRQVVKLANLPLPHQPKSQSLGNTTSATKTLL